MSAQVGSAVVLGYRPQGSRQSGAAVVLSYTPVTTSRRLMTSFAMPWAQGQTSQTETRAPMTTTRPQHTNARGRWAQGRGVQAAARSPWGLASKAENQVQSAWGQYLRTLALETRQPWLLAHPRDTAATAPWGRYERRLHIEPVMPWVQSRPADLEKSSPWGQYAGRPALQITPAWLRSKAADAIRHLPWVRFSRPLDAGWGVVIPVGGIGPDEPGVIVPIRKTYVTINSISLRRVEGDIPIPTFAFQMSLDADSWTWAWSATLPADALALIQPGSNGDPVEIEALVNGVPYRLCAESVGSQREFGQHRLSVRGRGKAALLDAPYAPVINHGNAGPRTAQQLMTDVLTINGVGIGWTVDWQLTDWLVPGNTWAHQGAYISAILNIAQAAGGYVQPHRTAQTLRILPRYPAAPWAWGSVTPDFELPAAVITLEGLDWQRKPDYSRVYVSGTSNGVLGQVTRAGTAGNVIAPMVTDPLITHADAARQRGLAELSDTGTQASVTLTLPVLAETGLIQPGQFVRYVDAGQSRLGLVRATSLAWSRPVMRQTIALETHI